MLEGGENSDQVVGFVVVVVVIVVRLREPTARCGERRAELDTALES